MKDPIVNYNPDGHEVTLPIDEYLTYKRFQEDFPSLIKQHADKELYNLDSYIYTEIFDIIKLEYGVKNHNETDEEYKKLYEEYRSKLTGGYRHHRYYSKQINNTVQKIANLITFEVETKTAKQLKEVILENNKMKIKNYEFEKLKTKWWFKLFNWRNNNEN